MSWKHRRGPGGSIGGGGSRKRGRSWRPPGQSAHTFNPIPTLGESSHETEWAADATHIAAFRPGCKMPGCERLALAWQRCGPCRRIFARCGTHLNHHTRQEVSEDRAAHDCPGPVAPIISLDAVRRAREEARRGD